MSGDTDSCAIDDEAVGESVKKESKGWGLGVVEVVELKEGCHLLESRGMLSNDNDNHNNNHIQ